MGLGVGSPPLVVSCSLFLVEERRFLHSLEIYDLLLGGKGEGRAPFLHLLLLN